MPRSPLDITITNRGGVRLVRLAGILDVVTAPRLRDTLLKAIADQPDAVIVDLNRLELRKTYTLAIFAVVARRTAEWSGVPLILVAGSTPDSRLDLSTRAIARILAVYPTVSDAMAATNRPPVRRLTRLRLAPQPYSAAAARRLVAATCEVWDCLDVADDATAVASELVANALTHVGTDSVLRLELRRDLLTVALTDDSSTPPVLRGLPNGTAQTGGFGLRIVDSLARAWGWAPTTDGGKVVWAVLRNLSDRPSGAPGPGRYGE